VQHLLSPQAGITIIIATTTTATPKNPDVKREWLAVMAPKA
jgi:hypothetical protein